MGYKVQSTKPSKIIIRNLGFQTQTILNCTKQWQYSATGRLRAFLGLFLVFTLFTIKKIIKRTFSTLQLALFQEYVKHNFIAEVESRTQVVDVCIRALTDKTKALKLTISTFII